MNILGIGSPRIQISTRAAKVNIRHRRPQFEIRHTKAKMEISKKAPVFRIKKSVSHVKSSKAQTTRPLIRFTGFNPPGKYENKNMASADNIAADFENDNSLSSGIPSSRADSAEQTSGDNPVPVESILLEWEKGHFEINWSKDIMEIEWDVNSPEIYVEPHDINIDFIMETNNKLRIKADNAFVGLKIDKKV